MNFTPCLWLAVSIGSLALVSGCSSDDEQKSDLGNLTVDSYSFHVEQEGKWAPGTSTNYAIKANEGTPKPDLVQCWYGGSGPHAPVTATFDDGDQDFDCECETPADARPNDQLYIQVTYNGTAVTGGAVQVQN